MQSLDILMEFDDGSRKWIEAATDADDARLRVRELAAQSPGTYLIFNQRTQQMIPLVDARKAPASAPQPAASS
jgi:hypothetical protein